MAWQAWFMCEDWQQPSAALCPVLPTHSARSAAKTPCPQSQHMHWLSPSKMLSLALNSAAGEAAAMVEEAVSQQQQQQRQGQGQPEAGQQPRQEPESASPTTSEWHHYYEDPDAARALALLETEIGGVDEPAAQINHLRQLLEKECESQVTFFATSAGDERT